MALKKSKRENKFLKSINESKIEDGNVEIQDHLLKSYKEKTAQVIDKVVEIGLPKENEQLRIITMKSFNSIALINYVAEKETIKSATLIIFAINIQAAKLLLELFNAGKIQELELVISSIRNAGYSIKSKAVELLSKEKRIKMMFVNSHAKISAIHTREDNYYVIEGSGNFSYNGRIEQYTIDNDKKIYNFTLNWVEEMKTKMKTKDLLIVN